MKLAYPILLIASVLVTSRMILDVTSGSVPSGNAPVTVGSDTSTVVDASVHSTELLDPEVAKRIRELLQENESNQSTDAPQIESSQSAESLTEVHASASPVSEAQAATLPSFVDPTAPSLSGASILLPQPSVKQQTPLHDQMVTPGDFEYLGAFRTPLSDPTEARFSYGGWAVTFRENGDADSPDDGHPGSLFIVGHRHHQLVAEISIPQPVISAQKSLDDLPIAKVLQPFGDVTGGIRSHISGDSSEPFEIGGMQVVGDRLHWTLYKYYNVEGNDYLSHGVSTTNLTRPNARGLWHLGPANSGDARWHSYKHAGYICEIPEPFASQYLGGRNVMSGLQISTGLTKSSQGPALYAYRIPDTLPPSGASLNALPMLWYSMERPVGGHHPADLWKGAAWLTLGQKQTIVVVGRKALGPVYYGPARPGDCYEYKGYHGSGYETQLLFYAPGDLVAATSHALADVQPWYRWDANTPGGSLSRFMFQKCGKEVGGLAYDRKRNLIYISEIDAGYSSENEWEVLPVIHVLRLVDGNLQASR